VLATRCLWDLLHKRKSLANPVKWTPSFGQENAEIKLGSQALRD